jgi:signal transduction histidine kinase
MTIRSKLFSGFITLILIFIINFYVNQSLSKQVIRNTNYINNSEVVIRNSNILHKNMIDMQSGYRGYLLTGQEIFLEPYYEGIKNIPPLIKEQKSLISSPKQKARLDSIMWLHQAWVRHASSLITTKQDTMPEASIKYRELFEKKVKTQTGKKINDDIRKIFESFDNYEYYFRQIRRDLLQKSIARTGKINLVLTIFSITFGLILSYYIIRIITGRISKMVNLAQEISKGNFKRIEDNQKDELKKLSESLNRMSQILEMNFNELKKKNNELDQFAYVVSHDLKAPLRGIDNIISWMEEDHASELTESVKRNLDLIKGRAKRLENMINGLLAYARIGKLKRNIEPVHIRDLLLELKELLVPSRFRFLIIGDMPVLNTEKIQIEQVFSNLISNAVKYNRKAEGTITINTKLLAGYYEFSVSDDGIGIQKDYFEKIFMIFQTLQERDAFESTGVGLAIVKKIIDEKKGSITVESQEGKGTTFRFTWPSS